MPVATTTHELTIDRWRPPSLNETLRKHWSKRARPIRQAADLLAAEAIFQGVPKAKGKRRVSLAIVLSGNQRPYDRDNAWKLLLDSCVKAGLLVDDSPEWCETGDVAYERGKTTRTTITFEDI